MTDEQIGDLYNEYVVGMGPRDRAYLAFARAIEAEVRASFRLIGYERINKHGQMPHTYPNEKPVEHPDFVVREVYAKV